MAFLVFSLCLCGQVPDSSCIKPPPGGRPRIPLVPRGLTLAPGPHAPLWASGGGRRWIDVSCRRHRVGPRLAFLFRFLLTRKHAFNNPLAVGINEPAETLLLFRVVELL